MVTDEELLAWLRERGPRMIKVDAEMVALAADRIEALVKERDAAYAKGFSDAETEISATAIGQQNIALHDQLSRAKAEMDVLAKISAARAANWKRDRAERLEEALQWCSGSADFNEGGVAREGWLKLCAPLLKGEQP